MRDVGHGSTRPDTVVVAVYSLAVVLTVMHIVNALACVLTLVVHVPDPSMRRLAWTAPRTGDTGQVEAGSGAVPRDTPAQRSTRPWGHVQSKGRGR